MYLGRPSVVRRQLSPREDPPRILEQHEPGQLERPLDRPAPHADGVVGQRLCQDTTEHVEFGQDEFQLVGMSEYVADDLDLGTASGCARRSLAMNSGMFEYHQCPRGTTLGKIQE